jgi:hypothetical protein
MLGGDDDKLNNNIYERVSIKVHNFRSDLAAGSRGRESQSGA